MFFSTNTRLESKILTQSKEVHDSIKVVENLNTMLQEKKAFRHSH